MNNPLIANLSLLFSQYPLPERFDKAAEYGFTGVEIQFPYDWPAEVLKARADAAGVRVHLINIPAGELLSGGKSLSCHPELQTEFYAACRQALDYARVLGVNKVNVLASNLTAEDDPKECQKTYIENIRYAAELMLHEGIQVCFEAVNHQDMPRYLMNSFQQMLAVYQAVAHPNAFMQYDLYHMAMMQEDVAYQLKEYAGQIGHIQFADAPGRGAPGTGLQPLGDWFGIIADSDYNGAVAAEYKECGDVSVDYGWLQVG